MFLDGLTPIFTQLTRHPISFMGGFVSGVLRLNLADEPVKSWLSQQISTNTSISLVVEPDNGKAGGPQTISIE